MSNNENKKIKEYKIITWNIDKERLLGNDTTLSINEYNLLKDNPSSVINNVKYFQYLINKSIEQNWQPYGELKITTIENKKEIVFIFIQPLVKYD